MANKQIGVLVGSLRSASYTRRVAQALMALLPDDLPAGLIPIGDLPLYNQDLDDEGPVPASWTAFRQAVGGMDGFLFATPEYNRSVPAVLKNALDVGSRPYGANQWGGKPGAVVSVSPGAIGAFGANHHLRQTLTCLDVYTMQQPEAYIGGVANSFDDQERLTPRTEKYLRGIAEGIAVWMRRF